MPPTTAEGGIPAWKRRFTAPRMSFPRWSPEAPDRCVVATNESGRWQVYAWDRASGERRQLSREPVGAAAGTVTADGEHVVWWHDESGDETGHWVASAFGGGEPRPLVADAPEAWSTGIAIRPGVIALAYGERDGFSVYAAGGPGATARRLYEHAEYLALGDEESLGAGGLSHDGTLLCLRHAEHGDAVHPALRVLDVRSGATVGEQWDPGFGLKPAAWSPLPGDRRLAITHERTGIERPALWDLSTGRRDDLELELLGGAEVVAWWPDASALLLLHEHEGRHQLVRYDLGDGSTSFVPHPDGFISGAAVRPDGEVWLRVESGGEPPSIRVADGDELIAPVGEAAPKGTPYTSFAFANPSGERVHGFYAAPAGPGPHPIVMSVHGGPHWAHKDAFDPTCQALVDHGFAVGMVNYRGSSGYGIAWRDALIGNPGFPEIEDVVAGLEALVDAGVARRDGAAIEGASWGGYITLLALGTRPELWAAGVAGIPVGDYVAAYEDESPPLQAWDRTTFGGSPEDVPELYRERSPITYVDAVRAPVLIIAGDSDSRCPLRQVLNYVEALRTAGGEVRLYRYATGHSEGTMTVEETLHQVEMEVQFLLDKTGVRAPSPSA